MALNNCSDQIHRVGFESCFYRDDKSRDRDRSRHGFAHRLGDLHAMLRARNGQRLLRGRGQSATVQVRSVLG